MAIEIILIALVVFLVAVFAMALGAIFGKRCLRGSCGGLSSLRARAGLPLCEGCTAAADSQHEAPTAAALPDKDALREANQIGSRGRQEHSA